MIYLIYKGCNRISKKEEIADNESEVANTLSYTTYSDYPINPYSISPDDKKRTKLQFDVSIQHTEDDECPT